MIPRKKGFTLIELLVVVSIIALLLSLLLPALNKARQQARAIACKGLIRQLAMAHISYSIDTNFILPISVNDPIMRPWYTFDEFREYVGLPDLDEEHKLRRLDDIQEYKPSYPNDFICPSAKYALDHPENGLYPMDRSYGMNTHIYYRSLGKQNLVQVYFEKKRSDLYCMMDALDWWVYIYGADQYLTYGEEWLGFETYGAVSYRHNDKTNVVFWDGHVEARDHDELMENKTNWLPKTLLH